MSTTVPIARVRGLTRRYGSRGGPAVTALDDVDLDLGPGVTGLLGPNGAGKTTLLSLLATSSAPTSGEIEVLGRSATGSLADRTEVRRHLGFLPQEVRFPRGMTCFGFVEYLAVLKEWSDVADRRSEVRRVLDAVGLGDRSTHRVRTLSGGQRRRLALAQALLGTPALLVLDEPTTGLDPEQRASLRATLSAVSTSGAVLLATHQTEDVAALCDRVVVLVGGRVLFDGSVPELVGTAEGRVWLAPSAVPGARHAWRTGTGQVRSVGGEPGAGAVPVEPSVEDAYLLLVGAPAAVAA